MYYFTLPNKTSWLKSTNYLISILMKTMTIFPHKTAKLLSELKLAYTFINSLMFDLIEGN